ncbi:MAG: exodeoxyribonuclease VII large subunit [Kiritimatiellia bacterium]
MADPVFTVAQLTLSVRKNLLANNAKLAGVWIEGEISGNRLYASGHRYFTLKDKDAAISCVLFAFAMKGCDEAFRALLAQGESKVDGVKVLVQGELDLNMRRGQYSFKVGRVRVAGVGDRMAQFNALKARLEAEGLNKLDHPELRRAIPFLPHRIAIVTSPAGAVIHDMCDVLLRRFPNVEIRLFPVKVQGEGAVASIAGGIAFFQTDAWAPDVLIVGRGGGSVEDLWAFNEEPVVRAVAASRIPVISAVGHESDTTLCDHVADLRAGTPSIAAERAVPVKAELVARVADLAKRLGHAAQQRVDTHAQHLDYLADKLERLPLHRLERLALRFASARQRLAEAPQARVSALALGLERAAGRLAPAAAASLAVCERRLQAAAARLRPRMDAAFLSATASVREQAAKLALLDPFAVLERGYSITTDAGGRVVRRTSGVASGDVLVTRLADGVVRSTVD